MATGPHGLKEKSQLIVLCVPFDFWDTECAPILDANPDLKKLLYMLSAMIQSIWLGNSLMAPGQAS